MGGRIRGAEGEQLELADRAAWRRWLAKHHADRTEVWLVYRKGKGASGIRYGESVEEALCFGWIDGLAKGVDAERYRQRFSPRRPGSRWSSSNKKRIAKLEAEGRLAPAGRRVVERARADGSWDELPDAERAFEDPPALLALLARNPEVAAIYAGFSPAHRRQYVLWIASAKKAETQERRAAKAEAMILARERPM